MQSHRKSLFFFRVFADLITITLCYVIAYVISQPHSGNVIFYNDVFVLLVLLLVWYISSRMSGLYDEFRSRNFTFELIAVFRNIIIQTISIVSLLFILKEVKQTREFVFAFSIYLIIFIPLERFLLRKGLHFLRLRGRNLRFLLIIGAGEVGRSFSKTITDNPRFGYRLVGYLDDQIKESLNGKYLGTIDLLEEVIQKNIIDDIIVALPTYASEKIDTIIKTCERYPIRVKIIPEYFRYTYDHLEISMFDRFPVISVRRDKLNEFYWRFAKRAFDIFFSGVLFLLVFWWLWPLIALAVKLSSPGPVFFRQERWGKDLEMINCYKFRTMINGNNDYDENGKFRQASKDDPRITKIGRFLRKSSLDELPQFWNVLIGEMSVVGPRPHPKLLSVEAKEKIHRYMQRHIVKPGITGWAQVNGFRGETKDPILMQKRIDFDLWYIENWSFGLDIQIIFMTVWKMIKGDPNAY